MKLKIGVFDSGVGGLSVADAIKQSFPEHEVVFRNDSKNVPYGTKSSEVLYELVEPVLRQMVAEGCKVIVIACNTVTTTIIQQLRKEIKTPLVGMEPMIKPASELTKSKIIAVFATPTTLASKRYHELKKLNARNTRVLEPDCSDWSKMIETNQVDVEKIKDNVNSVCNSGADIIVLGCTHYHWIEDLIKLIAGQRAVILQPEPYVLRRLDSIIKGLVL